MTITAAAPKMNVSLLDLRQQYETIRDPVRAAIDAVCDSQALILGKTTEEFERRLAQYCGTKHAIGLSSGTDALLAIFMAMDLKPGDEIICPSFTFFATAGCIHRAGAKPVFVDIEPDTFNIDPQRIADAMTPQTRGIMPVHLFGQCADMDAINRVAADARHGPVRVIEDAAQAIGATRNGRRACSLSWCGALSFYPTKNLGGFGDAGAVCTDDDELFRLLKLIRIHGSAHTYYHELVGGNFRIDALQAAVLNVKLDYLEKWHEGRRRNAAIYDEMLAGSGVTTPKIAPGNRSIYNQYVIRVPGGRDALKEKLAERGVGSAIYYPLGLHEQKCFAYLGYRKGELPETERACREVLALPIYPELREEQVRYVASQIREIVG